MEFIEAPIFTKLLGAYMDDDGYRLLQVALANNPSLGDVMPGTGGFRKVRWHDPRRGEGKRGGLRVIYYHFPAESQVWFLTLYGKDEAKDLTTKQRATLREAIHQEKEARRRRGGQPKTVGGEMRKIVQGTRKRVKGKPERRSLLGELMAGVAAMKDHGRGRLTLHTHSVEPLAVRPLNARLVQETRARFRMSRHVFARSIGVNPRTLERWEQGRSRPNDQAAVLIWLLRVFPDTLERLGSLPKAGAA